MRVSTRMYQFLEPNVYMSTQPATHTHTSKRGMPKERGSRNVHERLITTHPPSDSQAHALEVVQVRRRPCMSQCIRDICCARYLLGLDDVGRDLLLEP